MSKSNIRKDYLLLCLLAALGGSCQGPEAPGPPPSKQDMSNPGAPTQEASDRPFKTSYFTAYKKTQRRVVVLGFDGADPDLVDRWKAELPTISTWLGDFPCPRLRAPLPSDDAVAWTTFATSQTPGNHGIFQTMGRDPQTYLPHASAFRLVDAVFGMDGQLQEASHGESLVKSRPFWQEASDAGVRTEVFFVPYTFPPVAMSTGIMISGEGIPDLLLGPGTYFLLDNQPGDDPIDGRLIPLKGEKGAFQASIPGPSTFPSGDEGSVLISLSVQGDSLRIEGVKPNQSVQVGQFSPPLSIHFQTGPMTTARALVRFYPIEVSPDRVRVLMSPLEQDPVEPYVPFSFPPTLAWHLVDKYGPYGTLGAGFQISAFNSGLLPIDVLRQELQLDFEQRLRVVEGEIFSGDGDLVIAEFGTVDEASHVLLRVQDPTDPSHDPDAGQKADILLLDTYRWMDDAVRRIRAHLSPNDVLIVFSPHGMRAVRRRVDLNAWLMQNGYLVLREGLEPGRRPSIGGGDVDWTRSRAYSPGAGQIYVNLAGRERSGVVDVGSREALVAELAEKLRSLTDPESPGTTVVSMVLPREEAWKGGRVVEAPELQVTFAAGYESTMASRSGEIPTQIFVTRQKGWSADHVASDPADNEGFIVASLPGYTRDVRLEDIGPTALARLGVPLGADYDGRDWTAAFKQSGAVPSPTATAMPKAP